MMPRSIYFFTLICLTCRPLNAQLITGHRGASFDAPENTMAAFNLAWKQNADCVEGDFYLTKDNQVVCIHDKDTLRTTGVKKVVAESTFEELRALEYGSWKGPQFKGEPIPTFTEVLKSIPPGKKFVIELKTGPEIVPFLKEEIDRFQPNTANLLIIAFNKDTVKACKERIPEIKAHWLVSYKQNKSNGAWAPTLEEVADGLKQTKADGLGTQGNRDIVNETFIAKLKAAGLNEFHVWTIDDGEDARYFQKLGAMGITTNKPADIRKQLGK